MKPPIFSDTLYPLWCRAWPLLTTGHAQRLEQWLSEHTPTEIAPRIRIAHIALERTLNDAMVKLEAGTVDDDTLVQAFGCLRELEIMHLAEPRRVRCHRLDEITAPHATTHYINQLPDRKPHGQTIF